jgi:flagellar L-ring protein precursor FlgH
MCCLLLVIAGCSNVPPTNIRQPLTARADAIPARPSHNGAIFQTGRNERPLFEDRRARNVGDTLTINIVEVTSASEKSSSNADHSGSISATTPSMTGSHFAEALLNPLSISGGSASKTASKSDNAGNHAFSGTITATVVDVLPNGNLLVGGEKQVSINQASEYIRFSGVVNPANISGSNTVQSTQVADAQVEYKGANSIDRVALMSILARVFLSTLPF